MIRRPSSWPILWQLGGLALAAVLAAQAISFSIVAFLPAPPEPGLTIADVVAAIRAGGDGEGFRATRSPEPPFVFEDRPNAMPALIASSIQEALGLRQGDVHVMMLPSGAGDPADGRQGGIAFFDAQVTPRDAQKKPPPLPTLLRAASVPLAPFATAVLEPDGGWLYLTPAKRNWLTPLQQRALLAFVLSVAILAPLTWIAARWLSSPIRRFAEAAETIGPGMAVQPLSAEGAPELRAAIGAVNRMQERLRRHVEDRTTAVAGIAHDLRTPLTSLRLRAEALPPEARTRMTADLDRLIQMVEQVLAFVRGEQGREPRMRTDLGQMALECARELEEAGADVECRAEPSVWVNAEAVNLRRALTNLIDNAVKFGARARVNVLIVRGRAVFQVEDDGPGLPEGLRQRVFEPFVRAEPSRNRSTGGAGLGLAVVGTVARVHGGQIDLVNREGGGLTARLVLPLAGAAHGEGRLQRAV